MLRQTIEYSRKEKYTMHTTTTTNYPSRYQLHAEAALCATFAVLALGVWLFLPLVIQGSLADNMHPHPCTHEVAP